MTNTIKVLLIALAGGAGFASICILFTRWLIHVGRKGRPIQYPPYRVTPLYGPQVFDVQPSTEGGTARVEFPKGSGPVTLYGMMTVQEAAEAAQRFASGGVDVYGATKPIELGPEVLSTIVGKHPLDIGDGETVSDGREQHRVYREAVEVTTYEAGGKYYVTERNVEGE